MSARQGLEDIMKAIYLGSDRPAGTGVNAADRRVDAVMTSPVECVRATTTLADALITLVRRGRRHLAVVDDDDRFCGILSDRVVAAAWAADPGCLSMTPVGAALEARAVVSPGAHILDAARAMRAASTDAVAVIDSSGDVVGIVTGSDMIAQLAR
jgi:CBS domain-containing protein